VLGTGRGGKRRKEKRRAEKKKEKKVTEGLSKAIFQHLKEAGYSVFKCFAKLQKKGLITDDDLHRIPNYLATPPS